MIKLRNKTTTQLSETTCQELVEILEARFRLQNMDLVEDRNSVEDTIWKLTYMPVEKADSMGFSEKMTAEEALIIRNEIASQFRSLTKTWDYGKEELFGKEFSGNAAYEQLRKALDDSYALHEVVRQCKAYMYLDIEAISKTIGCLKSTWATSHDKGFARLQFTEDEQKFLVKARKEIASFLESLCSDRLEEYRKNKEGRTAAANHQKKEAVIIPPKDLKEEALHHESVEESTQKQVGMNLKEIISSEAEIRNFFEACDKMRIGIPEWLLANRQKVEKFLEACEQF